VRAILRLGRSRSHRPTILVVRRSSLKTVLGQGELPASVDWHALITSTGLRYTTCPARVTESCCPLLEPERRRQSRPRVPPRSRIFRLHLPSTPATFRPATQRGPEVTSLSPQPNNFPAGQVHDPNLGVGRPGRSNIVTLYATRRPSAESATAPTKRSRYRSLLSRRCARDRGAAAVRLATKTPSTAARIERQ
jgi:hypothetical protein